MTDTSGYDCVDLFKLTADEVYATMIRKATRGTHVRTNDAPSLATQFVKSHHTVVARANVPGAFAEITYPTSAEIERKIVRKHGVAPHFGYLTTEDTDAYPAGMGERAAKALMREENTFQLRGSFAEAALNFAKLRARVEARDGDIGAVERLFAAMWGLTADQAHDLPYLHIEGNEATRMSAMEDRAYHALSGHPGHSGGYRVDTASLAPDALGTNVPLNWPRMRTALKAIALAQIQGDVHMSTATRVMQKHEPVKFCMDIVEGSQGAYQRPYAWESLVDTLISQPANPHSFSLTPSLASVASRRIERTLASDSDIGLINRLEVLASTVTEMSARAYDKTIAVIAEHDRERAIIDEYQEEEFENLRQSRLSKHFLIPRYRVTRESLQSGRQTEYLGSDKMPDIRSHGPGRRQLNLAEFREAGLEVPIDIPGALNLAAYMTVNASITKQYVYMLIRYVPDPRDDYSPKLTVRLRRQSLYANRMVRDLGQYLLSDNFMCNLELLLANMVTRRKAQSTGTVLEIWNYLSRRCYERRPCPAIESVRDLIIELRTAPEGWTLYYWMRVVAGRQHRAISDGIMAPIHAGEATDLHTMFKVGIKKRTLHWATYYAAEYKMIETKLMNERNRRKSQESEPPEPPVTKYIPPHLRRAVDLEAVYDASQIYERTVGYTPEEYERMVEMQSKSKFFSAMEVYTKDSLICVGLRDSSMYEMLVEFYQARWYSLEKRINRAVARGYAFRLGPHSFVTHPWGELCTDLPDNYRDMLKYMISLDDRAWTIPPDYLMDKFNKSISELWGDVLDELATVLSYLDELHSGEVEMQDDAMAMANYEDAYRAMLVLPPIPLPSPGYTAPYSLPVKALSIPLGHVTQEVQMAQNTYVANMDDDYDDYDVENEELGDADDYEFEMSGISTEIEAPTTTFLTYRQIWALLALPDVDDDRMRAGFGVPHSTNLDDQLLDSNIGPIVPLGDEQASVHKWSRRMNLILMRCGKAPTVSLDDDM